MENLSTLIAIIASAVFLILFIIVFVRLHNASKRLDQVTQALIAERKKVAQIARYLSGKSGRLEADVKESEWRVRAGDETDQSKAGKHSHGRRNKPVIPFGQDKTDQQRAAMAAASQVKGFSQSLSMQLNEPPVNQAQMGNAQRLPQRQVQHQASQIPANQRSVAQQMTGQIAAQQATGAIAAQQTRAAMGQAAQNQAQATGTIGTIPANQADQLAQMKQLQAQRLRAIQQQAQTQQAQQARQSQMQQLRQAKARQGKTGQTAAQAAQQNMNAQNIQGVQNASAARMQQTTNAQAVVQTTQGAQAVRAAQANAQTTQSAQAAMNPDASQQEKPTREEILQQQATAREKAEISAKWLAEEERRVAQKMAYEQAIAMHEEAQFAREISDGDTIDF